VLLIYAAFHPSVRSPAMVLGATEKIALGAGVPSTSLRERPVAVAGIGHHLCGVNRRGKLISMFTPTKRLA